jgi:hypothetical protein
MPDRRLQQEGWWGRECGLFTVPLVAAFLAIALFFLFRHYGLILQADLIIRLFPGKLTMLSFLLAAAFVQYGYFFQMRWTDGQLMRAGEWPTIQLAKRLLEESRTSTRQDPSFMAWTQDLERLADPEKFLAEMARRNRPFFRRSMSLIYATIGACFVSAAADLAWLLAQPCDVVVLRELSGTLLVVTFAVLGAVLVAAVFKVRVELVKFFDF